MNEQINLPEELNIFLGSENREFAVYGRRARPIGSSMFQLIFSIVWLGILSFFISFFLDSFSLEGIKQVISNINSADEGNPEQSGIVLVIVVIVFVLIGLFTLIAGVFSLMKRGGYFVGTPTRLVRFNRGKMMWDNWDQFNGNIEVRGNNTRGRIILETRTGHKSFGMNKGYVPNIVYISGVPGVYEIEQICRKRIKEHDPTPVV
ncbi:MAG: hypothetical protein IPN68_18950 [Bacteroidetes bacterium]|nr:hypothetical protein [Bacteroidota bacterium]